MNFIPVQSYNNYIDAHIVMGQLEEQGIVCWLKDEYTLTIDPILTNALGGIKIMVSEVQAQRALDILETTRNEIKKQYACPKCAGLDVEFINTNRSTKSWFMALAGFIFGDLAITGKRVLHCFECGWEWKNSI